MNDSGFKIKQIFLIIKQSRQRVEHPCLASKLGQKYFSRR